MTRRIRAHFEVAGLPPKSLGEEPLRGQVFIDTKTNFMWGVKPTYLRPVEVTQSGAFEDCSLYSYGGKCQLAASKQFAGYSNWVVPFTDEAKGLFDGRTGTALSWLEKLGVRFGPASQFPGYPVAGQEFTLSVRVGLCFATGGA